MISSSFAFFPVKWDPQFLFCFFSFSDTNIEVQVLQVGSWLKNTLKVSLICLPSGLKAAPAGSEMKCEGSRWLFERADSLRYTQSRGILEQRNNIRRCCACQSSVVPFKPRGPGLAIKMSWKLHFPISSGFGWRLSDVNPKE